VPIGLSFKKYYVGSIIKLFSIALMCK